MEVFCCRTVGVPRKVWKTTAFFSKGFFPLPSLLAACLGSTSSSMSVESLLLLLLLLPLALASQSVLPTLLVAGLRVLFEVVDKFTMAIGVCGLAIGVEVYEARHIAVLLVGLGNAGRCRGSFTSSLLPTTNPHPRPRCPASPRPAKVM